MQLPQEHPKHTHDVLRVLPSPGTITAVTFLIFCSRAIKNVSNQRCPSGREQQLRAPNAPQDLGHGSVQLLTLPKAQPASCPSGHNVSHTSRPSPTSSKHSCTAIYSQTSFLCPQFRELLESFLLHLTGVTTTKQPIKISMGDYILTSINSYTSFTAVEGLVFFGVKRGSLKCVCSCVIPCSLRAGHKPSDVEQGTPPGLQ